MNTFWLLIKIHYISHLHSLAFMDINIKKFQSPMYFLKGWKNEQYLSTFVYTCELSYCLWYILPRCYNALQPQSGFISSSLMYIIAQSILFLLYQSS